MNPSQENELELKGELLLDATSRMEDERWPESITVHGADRYIKFKISHSPEKHLEFSNAIQSSINKLVNGEDGKMTSMGDPPRSSESFSIKKKSKSFNQRNAMSRGSSMKDIMKLKHDLERQSKSSSSLSSDSTTSSSSMKDVSKKKKISFFFIFQIQVLNCNNNLIFFLDTPFFCKNSILHVECHEHQSQIQIVLNK